MKKLANKDMEKGFFSWALFRQSVKSQRTLWLFTTIGNCLISIIVILILSTLSINTTKAGLSNLFSTAEMEHTVRSSAVETYLAYDQSVGAYEGEVEQLTQGTVSMYDASQQTMTGYSMITTEIVYPGIINKTYGQFMLDSYTQAYSISQATTDDEKNTEAIAVVNTSVQAYLNLKQTDATTKKIVSYFVSDYLNTYYQTKVGDINALTTTAIPKAAYEYTVANISMEGISSETLGSAVSNLATETLREYRIISDTGAVVSITQKQVIATNTSLTAILAIVPSASQNQAKSIATSVLTSYIADPVSFASNANSYRSNAKINAVAAITGDTAVTYAFWDALPSFTVEYITDDKGYPIYYGEDGKEIEITKTSDMDKRISVKTDMGTDANFLEKQHKELLTGTDYTADVKATAQTSAESFRSAGIKLVSDFLTKYIQNPDAYYDATTKTVKSAVIKSEAVTTVNAQATGVILKNFNVTSLDQLTKQNAGISGSELLDKVDDYSSSAIDVYASRYAKCVAKGYSTDDAIQVSLSLAGVGITDELPSKIKDNLAEMGKMNMYAILIGLIFFDCAGLLLPMVYTMMTANDLIAGQVDSGSLAFVLSTPTKRSKITATQALFLFTSITASYLLLFVVTLGARAVGVACGSLDLQTALTYGDIALDTLGGYGVICAIAGICFMASCFSNKTKTSLGVGGGLTIFFLVASILGIFGSEAMPATVRIDAMNAFNYCTLVRLFDTQAVIDSDYVTFFWKISILFVIAAISTTAGVLRFNKKDLPL
jgi:ABC-type transport system involved in multi-copper enzyme maturation permease subunit